MRIASPKILFVDDDADVLAGLRKALRKHRDRWDMVFAVGGPAGVDEVRHSTFDVVVSDMRMPELDGAALLGHVRDRDPTTIRIILSGFSDPLAVLRTPPVAHHFLDKPCETARLVAAIDRACAVRALLVSEPVCATIARIATLPPAPGIYHQLTGMLGRDVDATVVAQLIDSEPAIAANILELARSECFDHEPPATLSAAVSRLGIEMIAGLALVSQCTSSEQLQHHALRVARLARDCTPDRELGAEMFTLGLVHDVGKTLIASAMRDGGSLATHGQLGAYLLAVWGFPLSIIEAVACHDNATAPSTPLAIALRAAHA